MGCPPVRGDNPRALVSGLSYVQVDKHGIIKNAYISVDLAHHEIFHAKVGKGGIKIDNEIARMRCKICVFILYSIMKYFKKVRNTAFGRIRTPSCIFFFKILYPLIKAVSIQISWLLMKPADLYPHCFSS